MEGDDQQASDPPEYTLPGSSGLSKKRRHPDFGDILSKEGPLTEPPIENEYGHLDDDDDDLGDDYKGPFFNLKKTEHQEILQAQEMATITQYDDIKVTPFNLDEELEEGEFDKAGNFIFKKKRNVNNFDDDDDDDNDEVNDTWAESVDWTEVERKEKEQKSSNVEVPTKDESTKKAVIKPDKISAYKSMLRLMKPDEIVKKTIQRLGNSVPKKKPSNRNARSKSGQGATQESSVASDIEEARRKLDLMIELAHGRLEDGDVDIYQKSYEDLEEAINV